MNGARDQLLARTALTQDQHRVDRLCHPRENAVQLFHLRTLTENAARAPPGAQA